MFIKPQKKTLTKATKVLVLVLFLVISNSFAQNTTIPDRNFEQALIDLGYDTGVIDGTVPTDNIKTVTSLNVSNKNISDLTGIQDFVALINLSCASNNLTNLDFSENTQLTKLICSSNQLVDININKNVLLNWLDCSKNNISHLDLRQNTALVTFYCYQNQLLNLNISQNVLLTNLQCYRNQLQGLDVTQNTALTFLFCAFNNLTSLDVSKNVALKNLYCYSNQLTELDVSQNKELILLDCFRNQLTNLDVSQNTNLVQLYCYNNEIKSLDLSQNTVLRMFNCSNNQLSSLNIKSGANANINRFFAQNNSDLDCVTVDDPSYSTVNWLNVDTQVTFSLNCNPLSTTDFDLDKLRIYPNPVQSELNISISDNANYTLVNANGQIILKGIIDPGENKINVTNIANGVYYLIIKTETGALTSKKVIKT